MKSEKDVSITEDRWEPWMGPVLLLLLTLLMFGDVLFDTDRVLSRIGNDLSTLFAAWREFGFGQLRSGNLPLWNPYIFAGMPYLGDFLSAMLYPPNLLHLILPLAVAINARPWLLNLRPSILKAKP